MQSLENKGKIMMTSQEDAASCVNVTGTDRKIDARLTPSDSPDVHGWRLITEGPDETQAPWNGEPVLIYTDHKWTSRVHRAVWTDAIHEGIHGWAIEDCKHGPYPLRGYMNVSHWMPLPAPPVLP